MDDIAWWLILVFAVFMLVWLVRLDVVSRECEKAINVFYDLPPAARRHKPYSVGAFYHWSNMFDLTKWTWRQMAPELDRLEREHRA